MDTAAESQAADHGAKAPAALVQHLIAHAAARGRAYAVFARLFEYPDAAAIERIRSGGVAEEVADVLEDVAAGVAADVASDIAAEYATPDHESLCDAGDADALAVEFTRLFDATASEPPCPLYGGAYGGARMKTMEEAVRFYEHFGLTLSETPRELPDHLATQLEFLHFLAFREAETLAERGDAGPWCRAQRDFIARHPGRWVSELRRRLGRERPMRYFAEVAARLEALLAGESRRLARETGSPAIAERLAEERMNVSR